MLLFSADGFNPLLLLLAALAFDMVAGGLPGLPRFVPHPVQIRGRAVTWFDVRLNRERRSDQARLVRGAVTVAALVGAAAFLGFAVAPMLRHLRYGWGVEVLPGASLF